MTSRMRPFLVISAGVTRSRRFKSMTVTSSPRTLTTPMISFGARGTSVTGGSFRISRTSPMGTAYVSVPSRKARYSTRGPRSLRPRRGDDASRATRSAIAPHPHGLVPSLRESFLDERRRVEHERHALIAELGGAGESLHSRKRRAERLDDDVLLADDLIDDEAEPAHAHADDDGVWAQARRFRALWALMPCDVSRD